MRLNTQSQYRRAMTGNAGLNYAAWQLAKRGWHAMPTIRNARGSDLFVTNDDETIFFGVQSKALSKKAAVSLGKDGDELRSEWWIITTDALSDSPTCFILSNADVRGAASIDKGGQGGRWLEPSAYARDEFREAWNRLEAADPPADRSDRPAQRPNLDSLCGQAWALFDRLWADLGAPPQIAAVLVEAKTLGLNTNNVRVEFYRWRTFNGLGGRK